MSVVVFNSQVPIDTGQGVYMSAVAEKLSGADLNRGIDIFSRIRKEGIELVGNRLTSGEEHTEDCVQPSGQS